MLSDSQKLTIKVAIRRARENGTETEEIRKLSAGMSISEEEIRAEVVKVLGAPQSSAPAPASQPQLEKSSTPQIGLRTAKIWTDQVIAQLTLLRNEGKGAAEIAKVLGMNRTQVSNQLYRMSKSVKSAKTSNPACPGDEAVSPKAADAVVNLRPPYDPQAEIMNYARRLREDCGARILLIQINPAAGWATVDFGIDQKQFMVSFAEKREVPHE